VTTTRRIWKPVGERNDEESAEHVAEYTGPEAASEATTSTAVDDNMPRHLTAYQFDRILVSRITGSLDNHPHKLLQDIACNLKPATENPHARIVLLLTSATETVYHSKGGRWLSDELIQLLPYKWYVYRGGAKAQALKEGFRSVHEMRKMKMVRMKGQETEFFEGYIKEMRLEDAAKSCGLKIMGEDEMCIGPAWPYRLELSGTEEQQEKQFEARFTSMMKGRERLVELSRPCAEVGKGST
jgi:hypothetical protein